MRYKPSFNEYNGIKEVIKLYNRNVKRSQFFLYNVLDRTKYVFKIWFNGSEKAPSQIFDLVVNMPL